MKSHNFISKVSDEKSLNSSPTFYIVISKYHLLLLIAVVTLKRRFLELIPNIVRLTASGGTKDASVYLCDKHNTTKQNKTLDHHSLKKIEVNYPKMWVMP